MAGLRSEQPADFRVIIDSASLLNQVDFDEPFVPAHILGGVVPHEAGSPIPPLAIAVNGVVAAVTRTYSFRAYGHDVPWEVLVDPGLFEQGANTVGVYAITTGSDGGVVLREALRAGSLGPAINVITDEVQRLLGATSSGFHPTELSADGPYRWTTGTARISVRIDPRSPPSALTVLLATTGPRAKRVRITVNGCGLFEGPVAGRWEETFGLDACPLDSSTLEIELLSGVHLAQDAGQRRLGVAVREITLRSDGQSP